MSEPWFDAFEPFLQESGEFLITAHVDPDGDAVGSCLGLLLALRHRGKAAGEVGKLANVIACDALVGVGLIVV